METHSNTNLRITDSLISQLSVRREQSKDEEAKQRLHSDKECIEHLNYYLKTSRPEENGNGGSVSNLPNYSLLVQQSPADGPNDFDTHTEALKLGALELAVSIIENLSTEIAWADQSGNSWRDTVAFRMLLANI